MLTRLFLRRLTLEMPRWIDHGWIDAPHGQTILADTAARVGGTRVLPTVLGALGALLLGVGVILFFAANWTAIPRLIKLALVFGMLWTACGCAWALARAGYHRLAEAMVLLGVLLFGAAIMLVAQMYHLAANPPDGVLLWAAGAVLAAWLWPSQLAAAAGLALVLLWANLAGERPGWVVFWPFLPAWATVLPLLRRHRWPFALHAALLTLGWWIAASLVQAAATTQAGPADVLRFALALAAAFTAAGALLATIPATAHAGGTVQRYGLLGFVAALFLIAIPAVFTDPVDPAAQADRLAFTLGALAPLTLAVVAAFVAGQRRGEGAGIAGGMTVLALLIALTGLPMPGAAIGAVVVALNISTVVALIGLIVLGYRAEDRFTVNVGFLGFAATLLRLYFDSFWGLFDRSFFFMAGGLVVIVLGWVLEHQRRRLLRGLEATP